MAVIIMKTKISHLGRSSVSVILAVMMLLSTMLIGTVSTVNAIGADSSYTVHEGETLYLNLSNTGATEANFFEGNYIEGCNNKIKVLKRNAYGYRDFNRFRNRILHMFSLKSAKNNTKQAAV